MRMDFSYVCTVQGIVKNRSQGNLFSIHHFNTEYKNKQILLIASEASI